MASGSLPGPGWASASPSARRDRSSRRSGQGSLRARCGRRAALRRRALGAAPAAGVTFRDAVPSKPAKNRNGRAPPTATSFPRGFESDLTKLGFWTQRFDKITGGGPRGPNVVAYPADATKSRVHVLGPGPNLPSAAGYARGQAAPSQGVDFL